MIKRKRKIIDKQFQLKTIYSIMGITIITFLIIIAFIGIEASIKNKEVNNVIKEIHTTIDLINKNDFSLQSQQNQKTIIESIRTSTARLRDMERGNFRIISVMLAVVLIMSILLYLYLMNLTHRISGPLHVIKQYMDSIINGEEPEFRDLREKDEFKDLYYSFVKMIEKIKKYETKK